MQWIIYYNQSQFQLGIVVDYSLILNLFIYKWEFRRMIPNKKKQVLLRQYILSGVIKGKNEPMFSKKKQQEVIEAIFSKRKDYF